MSMRRSVRLCLPRKSGVLQRRPPPLSQQRSSSALSATPADHPLYHELPGLRRHRTDQQLTHHIEAIASKNLLSVLPLLKTYHAPDHTKKIFLQILRKIPSIQKRRHTRRLWWRSGVVPASLRSMSRHLTYLIAQEDYAKSNGIRSSHRYSYSAITECL